MLYITIDDFYRDAASCASMSRDEERLCARQMATGDASARERLIRSYLPFVAASIKHAPAHMQGLSLVLSCRQALEKSVDSFDFLQDSESFSHRLSWAMRQEVVKQIAK